MEINKKYKLEKAVSKDPLRENLQNIIIQGKQAFATDGYIMAVVPVKLENGDTPGLMSPDALKLGRKATSKAFDNITIALDGSQKLHDGTVLPRPEGDHPDRLQSILSDAQKKRKFKFGINVGLLNDLSDAIGANEVVLELSAPDKAILVRPLKNGEGEKGIIMPVRVKEEK
jgi:DNA polymerase III sliding clamp (beta) subunit (PCNA family)